MTSLTSVIPAPSSPARPMPATRRRTAYMPTLFTKPLAKFATEYKKIDPKINERTKFEAKKCKHDGIEIDTIVVSDEGELLDYIHDLEQELKGKTYHINHENMDKVLVHDYLSKTRKILRSKQNI